MIHEIFDKIGVPVLIGLFVILFILESRLELRKRVGNRLKRIITNTVVSLPSFALLRFLLLPVMIWLAHQNESWRLGINNLFAFPTFLAGGLAFLLLDYGNYIWHLLNHRFQFLWRFHVVHHTDPDLDITTAFRFHFGELVGSVISRGAVVVFTGATPELVLVYEICFEAATQFHHSNLRLPLRMEKFLNYIIVTPRMHGIHHSMVKHQTDSNYSVIFSIWDRIHKTICLDVKQDSVVTGVPSYSDQSELTTSYLLKMPFTKIREWDAPKPSATLHDKEDHGSSPHT